MNEETSSCSAELVIPLSRFCLLPDHEREQLCSSASNDSVCADLDHCYPYPRGLSLFSGLWCLINAMVGFTGNLLTLLAIPYAQRKGTLDFTRYDSTTLFILNLAFSDLLYCTFNLPMYSMQFFMGWWPLGHTACVVSAAIRYVNAFADWLSLGFIALSRCVSLIKPALGEKIFAGKSGFSIIAGIWIYAVALILPTVTQTVGLLGYNCRSGKCDFLWASTSDDDLSPHVIFYLIGFSIPCAVIMLSYLVIWCYVRASTHFLRKTGMVELRDRIQSRDLKMTWTIMLLCCCYLLFVMPIALLNVLDPTTTLPRLNLIFFCLYWFQYSLNFFIYALRSEHYRKAYVDFLCRFLCGRKEMRKKISTSANNAHILFIRTSAARRRTRSAPGLLHGRQALIHSRPKERTVSLMTKSKEKKTSLEITASLSLKTRSTRETNCNDQSVIIIEAPVAEERGEKVVAMGKKRRRRNMNIFLQVNNVEKVEKENLIKTDFASFCERPCCASNEAEEASGQRFRRLTL